MRIGSLMPKTAYFCMEYGLDQALDIYAGGLGILAGDFLKASKDLNGDVMGVGILWTEGYIEQIIEGGKATETFQHHNYEFLKDTKISFEVNIGNSPVKCKVYRTDEFGNSPLFLLDTCIDKNKKEFGKITDDLYPEDKKTKLLQQILLGKGGIKLLSELEMNPEIYHLNESDSVFVGLELLKRALREKDFNRGIKEVKDKIRFTTHTPIKAGNPEYGFKLLEEGGLFKEYEYSRELMKKLGGKPFNLTLAALRIAGKANAVSERHKKSARGMWSEYNRIPEIMGITNGVHFPTWQSEKIRESDSGEQLWKMHQLEKERLMESLDPELKIDKPLIGFAKRFPPYKRPDLIFQDKERSEKLLDEVNIVFSGKVHPANKRGKELVSKIVNYSKKYNSVTWINDYDIDDAKKLVKGCDIWLSCAIPPKEACSTSVIKAASNGVLNLSILDGWWWEACEHGINGWQFGDGKIKNCKEKQNKHDSKALYKVL